MTLKLILDRFEEDFAVCLDFDDNRYIIERSVLGSITINDVFTVEYDGECFSSPTLLENETQARRETVSKRMNKLFKMSRDRRPPKL